MRTVFISILSVYFLLLIVNGSIASPSGDISEGNKLYRQEKYGEAAESYNKALKQSPDSDIAHFNLGDALYKKGQYKEAVDAFTKALSTDNKAIEAKAIYNLANTKYKLGSEAANSDLDSAISMYREALEYYKRAMQMKEGDKDAKYNHELVEKKLKVLLEQAKNRKQDQDKNKDKEQDKKDKKEGKQSQEKSGQQKEEDQKQQSAQQNNKNAEDRKSGSKEDKGKSAGQDESKDKTPSGTGKDKEGMTPEEARMLLDAYGQEGTINDKHEVRGYSGEVLRDW
ncbi:MAG: tetratricopeptide repeat protein [Nitrospirota bacterium]